MSDDVEVMRAEAEALFHTIHSVVPDGIELMVLYDALLNMIAFCITQMDNYEMCEDFINQLEPGVRAILAYNKTNPKPTH